MTTQRRNDAMVELLRADFQGRYEPQFALGQIVSSLIALPGLVGLWPMAQQGASGEAFDPTSASRTLVYNGNPTYNIAGLVPYIDFDGTGDYLTHADGAAFDILGTESYIAPSLRGMTMGGWFWIDTATGGSRLMAKGITTGNDRAYHLFISGGVFRFFASPDGASFSEAVGSTAAGTGEWHFIVCRFTPSTEVAMWVNGAKETNTTSISASIFNATAGFAIGAQNDGSNTLDGRAALCFLSAVAQPDVIIDNLFNQSKALFGVF